MSHFKGCNNGNGETEVRTAISMQKYIFSWRIENLRKWPELFEVKGNEFKLSNDLYLYPVFEKCKSVYDTYDCSIDFYREGNTSIEVNNQLFITDSKEYVLFEGKPFTHKYDDDNNSCAYIILFRRVLELADSTIDDVLIFKCVMEYGELSTETTPKSLMSSPNNNVSALVIDLKCMFHNSRYTDFNLLVENNVLRVHRFILHSRSPVFAKMLDSPLDGNARDFIKIEDINLSTMGYFIEFLYTGNIPDVDFESVCNIYYAADKYDVSSLRKTCADLLLNKLDTENACRVLSLAHRHSEVELKDFVLKFMQFEFEAIMKTEDWFELVTSESELAAEVMRLRVQLKNKSLPK